MLSAEIAAAPVVEHRLCVFYDVDGLDPRSWTGPVFGDLTRNQGEGIPADQVPAMKGRYADDRVWEQDDKQIAGDDFHPHLRSLLSGERPDLLRFFRLTSQGKRFLTSADLYEEGVSPENRARKQLRLQFSKAAQQRILAMGITPCHLTFDIEDVSLALFMTANGFAICRYVLTREDGGPLSAIELLEAEIAIGRFNKVQWVNRKTKEPLADPGFTAGKLVRQMVFGSVARTVTTGRVTTYVFVRFGAVLSVADRDRYALLLARHYSTDYAASPEIGRVEWVRDFNTVRHAIAMEGAATVLGPIDAAPELPDFLLKYASSTFEAHYRLIALLALHEHAFLVDRTAASVMSQAEMQDATKSLKRLAELREAALVLRLCYRFSEQSYITMHNAVNLAWRKVLKLDEMLAELDDSIRDIAEHLGHLHEGAKAKKYAWTATVGSSALGGLTAYTITKETLGLVVDKYVAGGTGVAIGAVVAFAVAYFARRKGHGAHGSGQGHDDHFTVHAMLEHMIKRAQS
jgi:hypothetical protein